MMLRALVAALALLSGQAPPKVPPAASVSLAGSQLVVTLPYTLQGNPDSVLTTITGVTLPAHRRLASGFYATADTFMMPIPAAASGEVCASAKKVNTSAPACSPWTWAPPPPPVLPPIVGPTRVDTVPGAVAMLFTDSFAGGVKAPAQNGISYTSTGGVAPVVVADPTNASGFSLRFRFNAGAPGADAFSEQNMKLGERDEIFFCTVYRLPANYFHRSDGASNNKGIRVFGGMKAGDSRDSAYQHSSVKSGFSTLPKGTPTSADNLIIEFGSTEAATGNYGTGPWTTFFQADSVITIGFYTKAGTTSGTTNPISGQGVVKVWQNGAVVYDRSDLPIGVTGANNKFQYAYLLGWANSGFTEQTDVLLQSLKISAQPFASCTTP